MRLPRRLGREQGGYSLIELLTVIVILGIVLGALTSAFVQGSNAEVDLNRRFQAQLDAGTALSRLRRDVHCASSITPAGASSSITLTLPSSCAGGGGQLSWCAVGSGTRYGLYRMAGSTCNSTGKQYADYLTGASVFAYTAPQAGTSLAKLRVDLVINARPTKSVDSYDLVDDIVLRNSTRT